MFFPLVGWFKIRRRALKKFVYQSKTKPRHNPLIREPGGGLIISLNLVHSIIHTLAAGRWSVMVARVVLLHLQTLAQGD